MYTFDIEKFTVVLFQKKDPHFISTPPEGTFTYFKVLPALFISLTFALENLINAQINTNEVEKGNIP